MCILLIPYLTPLSQLPMPSKTFSMDHLAMVLLSTSRQHLGLAEVDIDDSYPYTFGCLKNALFAQYYG